MGRPQYCVYFHRYRQVIIISILFVLASSCLTQVRFMADGRAVSKIVEDKQKEKEREAEKVVIGSRPPRCEGRCSRSCGQCEAIQVPVGSSRITYSRGDDITNYKPMSWKCKCGNFIFNP